MKRFVSSGFAALFSFAMTACGGGDSSADNGGAPAPAPAPAAAPPAAAAPAGGALSTPDWMTVDAGARTVTIDLVAGSTDANNRWNYNGHANGAATVVVPTGYAVTINFSNSDPANFHSVAVLPAAATFPVMFEGVTPAFAGAMSGDATSMTEATGPSESETVSFTAGAAGDYALVCVIPAHAATGMWIGFQVSAGGEAGVRM